MEQVIAGWVGSFVVAGTLGASDGVLTDHGIVSHSNLLEILRQTQAALSATSNPVASTNVVTSPLVPARANEVAPVTGPTSEVTPVLVRTPAGQGTAGPIPSNAVTPLPDRTAAATSSATEHILGSEDVLEIIVDREPELSMTRAVLGSEGTVEHPLLGTLALGGKTIEQARLAIHEILARDYLVHPRVRVRLLESAPKVPAAAPDQESARQPSPAAPERESSKDAIPAAPDPELAKEAAFTILNQVYRPGTYTWASREKLTLLKAIGMAGGVTRSSALAKITVQRVVGSEKKTITLSLQEPGRSADEPPFLIQPGDIIEVGSKGR